MEGFESKKVAMEGHLAHVREGIRRMSVIAHPLGNKEGREDFLRVEASILKELETATALLKGSDAIPRIACPSCGGFVMPHATLCGFCWAKLTPTPTSL